MPLRTTAQIAIIISLLASLILLIKGYFCLAGLLGLVVALTGIAGVQGFFDKIDSAGPPEE